MRGLSLIPRAFYSQRKEHPSESTFLVIVWILCTKTVSDDWHGPFFSELHRKGFVTFLRVK